MDKVGWKTTEFWVTVGTQLVGLLISVGLINPDQATGINSGIAQTVAGVAQIVGGAVVVLSSVGYAVSRGLSKFKKKGA